MNSEEAIVTMRKMFKDSDKIVKVFVNQRELILYLIGVIRVLYAGDVPNFEELEIRLKEHGYSFDFENDDE